MGYSLIIESKFAVFALLYFVSWKITLACCFFINYFYIDNDFPFLQLLYLLSACSCLPTEVQGKPYKSQGEEEKRFTKDLLESNQAIQNETSSVRGKREATLNLVNLTDLCSPPSYFPPESSVRCEKGRYLCYDHIEVVCKDYSIHCLSNVGQHKFPKCTPEFELVSIDLGKPRGMITVRRTESCGC